MMKRLVEQVGYQKLATLLRKYIKCHTHIILSLTHFYFNSFINCYHSEEKEEIHQSADSTPQTTPIPQIASTMSHTPSIEQQPEVDEDGYCIQPKSPLWDKSKEG